MKFIYLFNGSLIIFQDLNELKIFVAIYTQLVFTQHELYVHVLIYEGLKYKTVSCISNFSDLMLSILQFSIALLRAMAYNEHNITINYRTTVD
jgi:hypothetical protein